MDINTQNITDTEDKPLIRADVEKLLREVGSPDRLNLSGRNLNGIDLSEFNLTRANLSGANLGGANLRDSTLSQANLSQADLRQADLVRANLNGADLRGANLFGADMDSVNLTKADLSEAYLATVTLRRANLSGAILHDTNLSFATLGYTDLSGADLHGADLSEANLFNANLSGAKISESEKEQLRGREALGLDESNLEIVENASAFQISIVEEPLTAYNLTIIISALTELSTKIWLITKGRFADLIEYTQTRDTRFAKETNLVITKMTHNSPLEIKLDAGIKDIAEALKMTIDTLTQPHLRYQATKLDNEAKKIANEAQALETKLKEQEAHSAIEDKAQHRQIEGQKAELDKQMALLEIEKQQLEMGQQRVALQKEILESEHQRVNLAFETASKIVERIAPNADMPSKAMLIQSLLPQLLQLGSGKGLELAMPTVSETQPDSGFLHNS